MNGKHSDDCNKRSKANYYAKCKKTGLSGSRYTEQECRMILNSNKPDDVIAEELGRTIGAIQQKRFHLIEQNMTHVSKMENLTNAYRETRERCMALWYAGVKPKMIEKITGATRRTIYRYINERDKK